MEAARARLMPFRESRAVLWRASRGERRGLGEGPTEHIEARGTPAAALDAAARWGWRGYMLSLLPAHTGGQES